MDATYGAEYRELYTRHWWWRARERFILEELERIRPRDGWRRILDVGCGDALFFDELSRFGDVEGVEPDAALVSPEGPHRSRIHVGPFDASFRPPHRYGLILMLDVVEHLADPRAALRHARELLDDDGTLFVTVPAFPLLWTRHDVLNEHYTRYTRSSFARLAEDSGFTLFTNRYFYHWMFAAKLATRAIEALRPSAKPAAPRVPPAWINRLLYLASRAEQRTSRAVRGAPPFGSSLLAIARKTSRPNS